MRGGREDGRYLGGEGGGGGAHRHSDKIKDIELEMKTTLVNQVNRWNPLTQDFRLTAEETYSLSLSLSLFLSLFLIVSNLHFSNVEQSDFAYCNLPMTLHVRLLVGRCLMISLAQKFNFNAYEKMIKNFFKYI